MTWPNLFQNISAYKQSPTHQSFPGAGRENAEPSRTTSANSHRVVALKQDVVTAMNALPPK